MDDKKFQYRLNVAEGRLYLHSEDGTRNVLASFGPSRILEWKKQMSASEGILEKPKTKIFYKGIFVCNMALKDDFDMLEYIDIKAVLDRKYLAINRSDFTDEGRAYIEKRIMPRNS